MSNVYPVSPMPEPHHFSDYGFDPHFDYFQGLDDARSHQRKASPASIDSIRFKLPKPTTTDFVATPENKKKKKRRWWNRAFACFERNKNVEDRDVHWERARAFRASAFPGPVYSAESGPTTPRNQHLLGYGGVCCSSPYLSLRELNMEQQQQHQLRMSGSASPIYLVT